MAITKINPVKRDIGATLAYIINPEKTENGLFVTGFNCTPEIAVFEFEATKINANSKGGRQGYHLIQSFAEGEVTAEQAHKIGIELAEKLLGGKYEFVVATHTNTENMHNHIVFNSVSFADHKKFHGAANLFHHIAQVNDMICHKQGLSVTPPNKNKGKSYAEYNAERQGTSWKYKLRVAIDNCILKSRNFDEFLSFMKAENYEIKQGKYISFRAVGQERFTRSKTLGTEYSEERIKERLQVITQTVSKARKSAEKFNLVIDLENNIKAQKSAGFAHWAKIQNLKNAANTMNFLTENGILEYADLSEKYESLRYKKDSYSDRIKAVEKRIKELDVLIKNIEIYRKTKPVVDKLNSVVFKEKYRREHESEFILFTAAEQSLKPHFKDGKPPLIKPLRTEINKLYAEKNSLYGEYDLLKKDFSKLSKIKQNVDVILGKSGSLERENLRKRSNELE